MAQRNWEILSCTEAYSGTNANGKPYSIFEVVARDPATGVQVPLPLRSFDLLPLGPGSFDVAKYERPGKETTYTLKKPGGGGGGGGGGVGALATRVEVLEANMEAMKQTIAGLKAQAQPVLPGDNLGGGSVAPPPDMDDDIPFLNDGFPDYEVRRGHSSRW